MSAQPSRLCPGLGMRCCHGCRHNVDNHDEATRAAARYFRPAAQPPARCMDFAPIPHAARDGSERP